MNWRSGNNCGNVVSSKFVPIIKRFFFDNFDFGRIYKSKTDDVSEYEM